MVVPDERQRPRGPTRAGGPINNMSQDLADPTGEELWGFIAGVLAKRAYPMEYPLHNALVDHYVEGTGAPFLLTHDWMTHVIAAGTSTSLNILQGRFQEVRQTKKDLHEDLFAAVERSAEATAINEHVVSTHVTDQAPVKCDDDKPSLGGFICHIDGLLEAKFSPVEPADKELSSRTVLYEFIGTMRWEDHWDFDPMRLAGEGERGARRAWRSRNGEEQTRLAARSLPGKAFAIHSQEVVVTQRTGELPQW